MKNRLARVNEVIKRELGTMLSRDFHFGGALVTVQAAEIAPDLRTCKVHVGVIGNPAQRNAAIRQLEEHRIMLQAGIAKRVTMKYTPQLTFHLDDSIERGVRVVQLLEALDAADPADPPSTSSAPIDPHNP